MKNRNQGLGMALKGAAAAAGVRQKDLAKRLGWSSEKICGLFSDKAALKIDEYVAICKELKIHPATLMAEKVLEEETKCHPFTSSQEILQP